MAEMTIEEILADVEAATNEVLRAANRLRTLAERLNDYAMDYLLDNPQAVADLRLAASLLAPREDQ